MVSKQLTKFENMNYLRLLLVFSLISINSFSQNETSNSVQALESIITSYQDHKGYDRKEYPLGLFTREYYKSEAEFAKTKLEKLLKVNIEELNENEKISFELLKFALQDQIDFYE
ncbi:MAG: hypothetical protein DRI75_13430, partial [Bacteroidetes bacterium]